MSCDFPPTVRSILVSGISHDGANVTWFRDPMTSRDTFFLYEMGYRIVGDSKGSSYMLAQLTPFITLHNLEPNTKYSVTVNSANRCGQTKPITTFFTTKLTYYDPIVNNLMPHEILLSFFIVGIWLVIRYFFITYGRVTFVSPKSGGYAHFDAQTVVPPDAQGIRFAIVSF